MKVSIITPVFNSIAFIDVTVSSVIAQTYSNWELILIDDNSADGSYDYLISKYSSHSKILIIKNEQNLGAGSSRNKGLDIATGRYIAFLDSDDVWLEQKLEKQIAFMTKHEAPISHTSYTFIGASGEKRAGYARASLEVDLIRNLKKTEIGTSTAIIDRSLVIEDFSFSMLRARQDLLLWIELLGTGYKSYGLDVPLVNYRVREGQVSGNKFSMLFKTYHLYMGLNFIPLYTRLYCFTCYALNAISKRLRRE